MGHDGLELRVHTATEPGDDLALHRPVEGSPELREILSGKGDSLRLGDPSHETAEIVRGGLELAERFLGLPPVPLDPGQIAHSLRAGPGERPARLLDIRAARRQALLLSKESLALVLEASGGLPERVERAAVLLAQVGRSNHIRSRLRDAEDVIRARVEAACDEWAESTTQAVRAFAEARRAREEAIARWPQRRHVPSQPGLFDRRAQRAQQAQAAINDEADEAALDRVRSIGKSAAIVRQPARLLLVLVP